MNTNFYKTNYLFNSITLKNQGVFNAIRMFAILALLSVITKSYGQAPTLSYNSTNRLLLNEAVSISPSAANVGTRAYGALTDVAGTIPQGTIRPAIDTAGNMFIKNGANLLKYPADGGSPIAITLVAPYRTPNALQCDNAGNLYMVNATTVYKIPAGSTTPVTIKANHGISGPSDVVADSKGNVYVVSYYRTTIAKFTPEGVESSLALEQSGLTCITIDASDVLYAAKGYLTSDMYRVPTDGTAASVLTQAIVPNTLTIDPSGYLYIVSDYGKVYRLKTDGTDKQTILTASGVRGVAVDKAGAMFVTYNDQTVLKKTLPTGGYYLNKRLPAGLAFSNITGIISGTPTQKSSLTSYRVTAYNGTESVTAALNLAVVSPNTNLSDLTISPGSLTPAFSADSINYKAEVYVDVTSVELRPSVSDPVNVITYNGETYAPGAAITVAVAPGDNIVPITVTSEGGATKTYTVTIHKRVTPFSFVTGTAITPISPSVTNAAERGYGALTDFDSAVPQGIKRPAVDTAGNIYLIDAGSNTRILKYPAGSSNRETITLESSYYAPIALYAKGGDLYVLTNSLIYKIPAGTTTPVMVKENHGVRTPGDLTVDSKGNVYVVSYYLNTVTKFTPGGVASSIGPELTNLTTITIDALDNLYVAKGYTTSDLVRIPTDGTASSVVTEAIVPNTLTIDPSGYLYIVSDYGYIYRLKTNGTDKQTILTISGVRAMAVDNAGAMYITYNNQTAFKKTLPTGGYYLSKQLPAGLAFSNVTGVISGTPVRAKSTENYRITGYNGLQSSSSTIGIGVVTYDADLSALALDRGTLNPAFNRDTLNYTAAYDTTVVKITPTLFNTASTVKVNDLEVVSGTASQPIPLLTGSNVITIEVTALNGSVKTYTVTIVRPKNVQTITFDQFAQKFYGDANFEAGATASSGLPVTYTSADTTVATVVDGIINIVAAGKTNITATQAGDADNEAASAVQELIVQPKPITVAIDTGLRKMLGEVDPVFTYTADSALIGSDTFTGTLKRDSGENAGIYVIGQGSLALSDNYAITLQPGTFTIEKGTINVYADNKTKKYGEVNPVLTYRLVPSVGSGPILLTSEPVLSTDADTYTDAGEYEIRVTGGASDNYNLLYNNGTLTIEPLSAVAQLDAYTLTADGNSTTNDAPASTNNASFGSSVTSVIINPAVNAGASVSVKRADGSGPDAGEGFSLAVGGNTFNILVTAEDNVTTVNYQLVITRAAPLPANTNLTLSISGRSLLSKQARGAANVNYKTSVDPATASIDVTPKTEDPLATVTVNGTTVTRGTAATVQLPANPTEINMLVTAQNGQTKTYQIIVEKNGSNNADLDITLSSKSILYQTTGTAQVNYRTTVDAGTESIMIKPRSDEPNAVVTVNGIVVPRSTFSEPIALDGQLTIIDMRIVAQDGVTSRTYTIAVTKTGSNNANMKFALSGKPVLNPLSGGPAQENYKTTVAVGTSSITITPTFEDANASVIIDGQAVANKTASQPIELNTPTKLVTMLLTAQDGTTTRSYSVEITKAGSNNANIAIKLTPASKLAGVNAGPAMYNYTTSVDPATTVLTVKPTSEEPNAIVTVDGNEVVRGASAQVALNADGITMISLRSIAQDGVTVKTYSIAVSKNGSNNADVDFRLSPASELTQAASGPALVNYKATAPFNQSTVKIVPTAGNGKSVITIDGNVVANKTPSQAIALSPGLNMIPISVTAQDGVTTRTYSIALTVEAAPPLRMASRMVEETPVEVSPALSPNGDGINDYLAITGIEAYPKNKLSIMNSKGAYVFDVDGYDNIGRVFDGHSKTGTPQVSGTYFYLLEYETPTGTTQRKTGYIVLKN